MKLKLLLTLLLLASIGVCGYVIPDSRTLTLAPGEMQEVSFTFRLEPGEVNATISLQDPADATWIVPSDYFPKTFTSDQQFTFVVKVPENYTQTSKLLTFVVSSGNETLSDTYFRINVTVNLPTPYYKVWGGVLSKGDSLLLPGSSKATLKYLSENSALFSLSGCSADNVVASTGENASFSCAGIDYKLSLNWIFEHEADVSLYSTSPDANVTKQESTGATDTIELYKLSSVCPGKVTIIRTAPGTITVTDSKNMAVGTFTSSSGYYQFVVPEEETTMLSIRVTAESGEEKIFPLEIDENCPETKEPGTKALVVSLLNDELVIGPDETTICTGAFVKDNSTRIGVKDAAVVVFNEEISTYQSGIAGYVRLCFNHSGTFRIYAEKEGYEPSEVVEISVTKLEKPKVTAYAYVGSTKVLGNLPYDSNVSFWLLKEDGNLLNWSGSVRAKVIERDGDIERLTIDFTNGKSDPVDPREYEEIKLELSEIADFEANDKTFNVAKPPAPDWFTIILLYVVLPVGIVGAIGLIYKKLRGRKPSGGGFIPGGGPSGPVVTEG
ncbi:MAG: hypothetical protein DRP15_00020 [Candidatus Aenigmatarchaeota archaeon]|nr:MAG: hypothetical protein DRP15_00020 [Candidatus Aenigmarchaeota archaeon]